MKANLAAVPAVTSHRVSQNRHLALSSFPDFDFSLPTQGRTLLWREQMEDVRMFSATKVIESGSKRIIGSCEFTRGQTSKGLTALGVAFTCPQNTASRSKKPKPEQERTKALQPAGVLAGLR